jgi:hypothetical protein
MSKIHPSLFLRCALLGDAAASGATGFLMFAGAGFLTELLGLPETLLRVAGIVLIPYAAAIAYLGTREVLSRWIVWAVITANAVWVADSTLLLVSGWVSRTIFGTTFVVFQAVVVAAFAEAQFIGLRRAERAIAAAIA